MNAADVEREHVARRAAELLADAWPELATDLLRALYRGTLDGFESGELRRLAKFSGALSRRLEQGPGA